MEKAGRNDPCPCGSGLKYKKCCWLKSQPQKKKLTAKVINSGGGLMQRAFKGPSSVQPSLTEISPSEQEVHTEENATNDEKSDENT